MNIESKQVAARGPRLQGRRKYVRELKRNKLPFAKYSSHRYEMYSVGNIVNNVMFLYYSQ